MSEQARALRAGAIRSAPGEAGLMRQLRSTWRILRAAPERQALALIAVALVAVIGATAYGQIALNAWNQPFYDALVRKDLADFGLQLGVFGIIAGGLLVLNVAQNWLNQMAKLKLRESLTRDLVSQWLAPKRALLLAGAGEIGVNPDQRIHEDAHHLTELSTDLGIGLFQAALLLLSFIGVLWSLSAGVIFEVGGKSFAVPGYMVWCALFYAGAASYASWRTGRPLVKLNADRYARESDLRFALVHANEHCDGVAVYRGEAGERERLLANLQRLLDVARRLVSATTRLTGVTAAYGWFTIVAPVIVAAPAYFAGNLTFGGLLMAVGAFTQVQQSLRWFVDNAGVLADWRATMLRVGAFRTALFEMDRLGEDARRITMESGAEEALILDDLHVFSPGGSSSLSETLVKITPGERVLITGAPRSGKTSLFRALAGLWPWGGGRIVLPASGALFMPKQPYLPDGPLRNVLAYPLAPEKFAAPDIIAALTRMGLGHLTPALDEVARWDKVLSYPEQQALAFARVLLHKPRWVVVDAAIETLAAPSRQALFDALQKDLPKTALISIGGGECADSFYTRILNIRLERGGDRLRAPQGKEGAAAAAP